MTETLEALFDMRLPIPPGVVRCLTEGVDPAMQKWAPLLYLSLPFRLVPLCCVPFCCAGPGGGWRWKGRGKLAMQQLGPVRL